mmetsp:Transcript_24669/g.77595  ORF Transcript_24669/g.77595 Transcript_24669/m.77595 type:complete len:203 (-) Transcript_24669:192-800(-)
MSSAGAAGPFKIVILGDGRVGKTSLLRQYVRGTFDANESSTMSAAYLEKAVTIRGGLVHLTLWDTAGQERFRSVAPIYYRGADGALLVYDITDAESFRHVAKWVEELRVMGTHCALAIVGNKTDIRPQAEAEAYANSIGARHSLASAKLGCGVAEAFAGLAEDVVARARPESPTRRGMQGRVPLVADDRLPQARRGGCCGGQ